MSIRITLSLPELAVAAQVGCRRMLSALAKGSAQANGCTDTWTVHVEGACGECAVAAALGVYWAFGVDTYHRPDVGDWQVRTRSEPTYELLIRPNDDDEQKFVLVRGRAPTYDVVGWIHGAHAKRPEWLQTYGGRAPAYFVPDDQLRPIHTLLGG